MPDSREPRLQESARDLGVCPVCNSPDGVRRCEGNLRDPDTFYCENHDHVTVWVGRYRFSRDPSRPCRCGGMEEGGSEWDDDLGSLAEHSGIDTSVCEFCEGPLEDSEPWRRGMDGCGAHERCLKGWL